MKLRPKITIADHFNELEDPRIERTKLHKLIDIITITICAVICGADGWADIELYGKCKYKWLKKFLELPFGNSLSRYICASFFVTESRTITAMFSELDRINKSHYFRRNSSN